MHHSYVIALIFLACAACSGDSSADPESPDGSIAPDGRTERPDGAALPDASPAPDANLSPHAFVTVEGVEIQFDEVFAYAGGASDRTISAHVGPDCPFGVDCTTLYVSFPEDAAPGYKSCSDLLVSVQLSEGSNRFFSFGSAAAFCGFQLDVNDGSTVAVSDLSAHLERNNDPSTSRDLSDGHLRSPFD